ncbi:MAG: MBOAT family protein [Thermodesulfobacteriota bacterium]
MHFTTGQFAVFFLIVLSLNWCLRGRPRAYRPFLLAANAFFYGSLSVRFLPLLLAVGLSNWFLGLLLTRTGSPSARKWLLFLDVALNLGLLAFFKYFEFFYDLLEGMMLRLGLPAPAPIMEVVFPIGLSFFSFQGLSYALDLYRRPDRPAAGLLDVLLFVSFFPTVLSGPIMRADDFLPQLTRPTVEPRSFDLGFALILSGLFKKVVLASYLSEHIVRQVFQVPLHYSSWAVLAGVYSYSIQIYCDFSGYSDLAIGLALLMGYRLPDNFRQPYTALNAQDFWRRWHISLSTWLRDYLYIPLGGNRSGRFRKYINLMITMLLGGLWHGAHSRFLLWGALHGLWLAATHVWQDLAAGRNRARPAGSRSYGWLGKAFSWFVTFNLVSFLWVFFRAEDSVRAFEIFQAAFSLDRPGAGFEFLVAPAILTGLAGQLFGRRVQELYLGLQERLPAPLKGALIAALCLIIIKLGPEGVLPFIYFQF